MDIVSLLQRNPLCYQRKCQSVCDSGRPGLGENERAQEEQNAEPTTNALHKSSHAIDMSRRLEVVSSTAICKSPVYSLIPWTPGKKPLCSGDSQPNSTANFDNR
jgi:hypothetical protein